MTADEVRSFVASRLPGLSVRGEPVTLAGGLMNFVWRVPAEPKSVIVKHAPPYIATAPAVPLDASRIEFEAACLQLLGAGGPLAHLSTPHARPPQCLAFDAASAMLVMEDVGDAPAFHRWLLSTDHPGDMPAHLGAFIGALHRESAGDGHLKKRVNNLPVQQTRNAVQYRATEELCEKAGLEDAAALGEKARALGERLLQPGRCLIMGDLWPLSILVVESGLRIIDWEFAHFGNPAQDVAHLGAHLWMLAHRHPEKASPIKSGWQQFVKGYRAGLGAKRQILWTPQVYEDAGIHFGAEILVRTVGAFQSGYLYEGLSPGAPAVQEAIAFAGTVMRDSSCEEWLNLE